MKRFVIVLLLTLSITPLLLAGDYCYRPTYYYPQSYCAPSYPTYSTYCPPEYKYVQVYPKAVEVAVTPDYYYSTSGYYQNQLQMEMLGIIKAQLGIGQVTTTYNGRIQQQQPQYFNPQLQAQQQLGLQQQQGYPQQQQQQQQGYPQQQQQSYPQQQQQRFSAQQQLISAVNELSTTPGQYQDANLLKVAVDKCAECHSAKAPQGNFAITTADDRALTDVPTSKLWEAFGRVASGDMPKNREQLSDSEVKMFYDWVKSLPKKAR